MNARKDFIRKFESLNRDYPNTFSFETVFISDPNRPRPHGANYFNGEDYTLRIIPDVSIDGIRKIKRIDGSDANIRRVFGKKLSS